MTKELEKLFEEAKHHRSVIHKAIGAATGSSKEKLKLIAVLEQLEKTMLQIATQVAAIVNAANQIIQNTPQVPVGGAIVDAAGVTAINAQAAAVNQPPIPPEAIQPAAAPPAA